MAQLAALSEKFLCCKTESIQAIHSHTLCLILFYLSLNNSNVSILLKSN